MGWGHINILFLFLPGYTLSTLLKSGDFWLSIK